MQKQSLSKEELDEISAANDEADRSAGIEIGDSDLDEALEKVKAEMSARTEISPETLEELRANLDEVNADYESEFGRDFLTPNLWVQKEMERVNLGFVDTKVRGIEISFTLRAHLDDDIGPNIKLADALERVYNKIIDLGARPANLTLETITMVSQGQIPDSIAKLVMHKDRDYQQFDVTIRIWAAIDIPTSLIEDSLMIMFAISTPEAFLKGE